MDKGEVFNLLKTKGRFYCQEKQFIKKFPDIYDDICRIDFPDDFTLIQKMYHYFMDDPDLKLGICPVCGNRCKFKNLNFGYWNHCSSNCASIDKDVVDKLHQTNLKRYGVENILQSDDVKKKIKETYIEHYGVEHPMKNKEYKDRQSKIMKSICNSEEYKSHIQEKVKKRENTCIEKYGVKNVSELEDVKTKRYVTKKKHNTFNTSKIENELITYLSKNNIKYIHQYVSELYPYNCDFYLPDYDLYIEIQGSWTHGNHPFNVNNFNDINKLEVLKEKSKISVFYKTAINVWTVRDVEKRETAKKNNLNYLEIFSIDFDYCVEQILNRLKSGT